MMALVGYRKLVNDSPRKTSSFPGIATPGLHCASMLHSSENITTNININITLNYNITINTLLKRIFHYL